MRIAGVMIVSLLLCVALTFAQTAVQKVYMTLDGNTDDMYYGNFPDNPPPIDSTCIVFSGVDYGGDFDSPQAYPNAKKITNVQVGSYYYPVVIWQNGVGWHEQSVFSYWDDLFQFWSYPDSFTSSQALKTGRTAVSCDTKGNLHFCWYQYGNPDGYEVFYTRAFLDTSGGVVQYNVERPAIMISQTNGTYDWFPNVVCANDTLVMVTWTQGLDATGACYNYSTDAGTTWAGQAYIYDYGGVMPCAWLLTFLAPDPNSEDFWVSFSWDWDGSGSQDITAYHWDAGSNTWNGELAAAATSMHPYSLPALVVDYNSVPHIVFQENLNTDGGVTGGLTGWNQCGPAGTLYYIHRNGGTWSAPNKVMLPTFTVSNYEAGFPSIGVATDNTIYLVCTQPESASADTNSAYLPFNAHYGEISPYTGAISYGGMISTIPVGDTANAIYPHITHKVPLGGEVPADMQGPGITWAQMVNSLPPTDIYYNHSDSLAGIEEGEHVSVPSSAILYQNQPNPAGKKTVIRFTVPANRGVSLNIYDISGRLVKKLAGGVPRAGSYFSVWDGKDSQGIEVPGGVYLYTLKVGTFTETRKLVLVR
jgi:hypothetical protein